MCLDLDRVLTWETEPAASDPWACFGIFDQSNTPGRCHSRSTRPARSTVARVTPICARITHRPNTGGLGLLGDVFLPSTGETLYNILQHTP